MDNDGDDDLLVGESDGPLYYFENITTSSNAGNTHHTFKYQAVVRDSVGAVLGNQPISLRISIVADGPSGAAAYREIHEQQPTSLAWSNFPWVMGLLYGGILTPSPGTPVTIF